MLKKCLNLKLRKQTKHNGFFFISYINFEIIKYHWNNKTSINRLNCLYGKLKHSKEQTCNNNMSKQIQKKEKWAFLSKYLFMASRIVTICIVENETISYLQRDNPPYVWFTYVTCFSEKLTSENMHNSYQEYFQINNTRLYSLYLLTVLHRQG